VEIDLAPWLEAASLLYDGPWLAERYLAIEDLVQQRPQTLLPITRDIISAGAAIPATAAFRADHRLRALKQATDSVWAQAEVGLLPTAGTHYTIDAVEHDPIRLNSNLGRYTNFMNLLDLCACAIPAGTTGEGLPFGITLFAPAFNDTLLLHLAARWQGRTLAVTSDDRLPLVVCGAHMSGLPLNAQLTSRGGRLVKSTRTVAGYRLYALPGGPPERPGLVRDPSGGAIEVEVWALPKTAMGDFMEQIPAPLGIGRIALEDGSQPHGFVCESAAVAQAKDITGLGGWRRYLQQSEHSP
jgi:allophanate hydrolase